MKVCLWESTLGLSRFCILRQHCMPISTHMIIFSMSHDHFCLCIHMCTDHCSHAMYYYGLIRFSNLLDNVWNENESYSYAAIVRNGVNSTLVFYNYHSFVQILSWMARIVAELQVKPVSIFTFVEITLMRIFLTGFWILTCTNHFFQQQTWVRRMKVNHRLV